MNAPYASKYLEIAAATFGRLFLGAICVGVMFSFPCASHAAGDWLSDEVLRQLQELRMEVKALRAEVATLRDDVKHLAPVGNQAAQRGPATIALEDDPRMGHANAKVAIVEFSDFECPFCAKHNKQTLPQISDSYVKTGQVQFAMKDYPLAFRAQAKGAAVAGHYAAEQDA